MTRFDVWVPEESRSGVLAALESLGALDADVLQLPVTANGHESGPLLSGEQRPGGPTVIGWATGYDVFGKPGWTPEKFAEFVTSRSPLHVFIDGNPCPTLAALAGYLQTPLLVDETYPTGSRGLALLTTDGNVALLRLDGGQDDSADLIREAFFAKGLDSALAVPGWDLAKSGPPAPYGVRNAAFNRRMDLAVWKGGYEFGKVAVPKGAKLIPLNMVITEHEDLGGERPVIGHVRSSEHLYEVIVPALDELGPLEVQCAVDGVLQRFVDPVTGEDKGFGAHAADWADWILRHSVPDGYEGRPPAGQPWEGDEVGARMYRLAHNIVNYEDHHADTTYFSTAGDIEAWLRRSLGHHNAPLTVRVLDDVAFTLAAEGPVLIQQHIFDRSDGPDMEAGYQANAFRPWTGKKNWWNPERLAYTRNPSLNTVMDGQALQAFTAANCLDYADLEPYLLPVDERANENSWFVVRLGDTPTCIAFPSQRTILTVNTDHDGATAEVTAHNYFRWVDQRGRKNSFEKQWARWLDESLPLTAEEIQAGLKTLEQIIERSDDEPDDE